MTDIVHVKMIATYVKKNHKQTKFSIRTGWVTIIPCRKTYKSQYKKAKAEKNQEPKSPYIDVDP